MSNNNGEIFERLLQRYSWMDHSACRGKTNLMFPNIVDARALCAGCPVKPQCLEYALEFPSADMHGVWAGLTSRQLAAEQRRRGIKPTRPTLAQMWDE
jgi:WhiB family redox-sensing transcriptional regulator